MFGWLYWWSVAVAWKLTTDDTRFVYVRVLSVMHETGNLNTGKDIEFGKNKNLVGGA